MSKIIKPSNSVQMNMFDRVPPLIIWEHNPDKSRTCQTQGKIYCSVCGAWIGYTGMYGWRLKENELEENSADEWISPPVHSLTHDGRCKKCKSYLKGTGAVNGGVNLDYW